MKSKFLIVAMVGFSLLGCDAEHIPGSADLNENQSGMPIDFSTIEGKVLKPGRCLDCHNPEDLEGGVDLSSQEVIRANPLLFKPGNPNESLLFTVVRDGIMPPQQRLDSAGVELLRRWILGATP